MDVPSHLSAEWTLDIVGDGPERDALTVIAGGDPRVTFRGSVPYAELDQHYARADVLMLPSDNEAWGLVVNEALAFGCRVLVSDQVGAGELLSDPELGVVLPVGNVTAWREAMIDCQKHLTRRPVDPYDPTPDMLTELRALGGIR